MLKLQVHRSNEHIVDCLSLSSVSHTRCLKSRWRSRHKFGGLQRADNEPRKNRISIRPLNKTLYLKMVKKKRISLFLCHVLSGCR